MGMTQIQLLVVVDDLLVLNTLALGLRQMGYSVKEAESAEEAILVCTESSPDMTLLDINMPGQSGLELAQWMAERGIPFLFLTAYDNPEFVHMAQKVGALGYLVKPLDVSRIIPALKISLARSRDLAELRDQESKLVSALQNSREISTAVGILMEREDMSAEQSFALLRDRARGQRRKVREVAREIAKK